MKTWTRTAIDAHCGGCRRRLFPGDPALEMDLPGIRAKKLRCPDCAGSEAPPDLPAAPSLRATFSPMMQPISHMAAAAGHLLPLDLKQRAAGREPGEDDL